MAPKGYEVAARDLRNFGNTLKTEAADYGKQKTRAEDNKLEFTFPLLGLMFKGSFNTAEGTVVKALEAFSKNLDQTGKSLVSVADAYEERERQNAETAESPNKDD
ncbi:MAG TPA: hypothetical protein VI076_12580 [Actinopolymorphaceae bacterium]